MRQFQGETLPPSKREWDSSEVCWKKNEFFCVPVGKSRQAAIFLWPLVKNAIEEGKRIPKRMEMGSDLGTCIKWIEDIGVPVIYAYSAYYSAKCRGMMKGEGPSMRVALEFISTIFGQLSADECLVGGNSAAKGRRLWRR